MPILNDNKKYIYVLEMVVRDYELDAEQIVNNANYLHYMEHTRHSFCSEAGLSFAEMRMRGLDPVVRKVEIEYFNSLRSGDHFLSCLKLERKGPRFVFKQDILFPTGEYAVQGQVTIVCLKDGKLTRGNELADLFKDYL